MNENVYRKLENGRYEPFGRMVNQDWLGDGIWAVYHEPGSISIRNMNHYSGIFKVGNISYPDLSKLAGLLQISDKIATSDEVRNMLDKPHSLSDVVTTVLTKAVNMAEEIEEKSKNRPLRVINEAHLKEDGFEKGKGKSKKWTKKLNCSWYTATVELDAYDNPRFSDVTITNYEGSVIASFRAEFMHQIYTFAKIL